MTASLNSITRPAVTFLVVAAVLACTPARGEGATVSRSVDAFANMRVLYQAVPGETNLVSVFHTAPDFTVIDANATLTAGSGCSGGGSNVTCPDTSVGYVDVRLDDGNDSVQQWTGSYSLHAYPGAGNDTVIGNAAGDNFYANATDDGADTFTGGGGTDQAIYWLRTAPQTLSLDDVANDGLNCPGASCEGDNIASDVETIWGGSGDDVLIGSAANNTFYGCNGNDTIEGGAGDDALNQTYLAFVAGICDADVWNDVYQPGTGTDTIQSNGGGNDTVTYADRATGVTIANDGAADSGSNCPGASCEGDTIPTYISTLIGGSGNDTITGGANADTLSGSGGADIISGAQGNDSLYGGDGNDFLNGGDGVDTFFGEAGDDTLYSRDSEADSLSCGADGGTADADSLDLIDADCTTLYRDGQLVVNLPGGGAGATPPASQVPTRCTKTPRATKIRLKKHKKKRRAVVTLRARGSGICKGKMTVRTKGKYRRSRKGKKRRIVLGRTSYALSGNSSQTVTVKVRKKAAKLLRQKKKIRVTVTLTLRTG